MPAANSKINDSAAYESLYVHKVYDQIASHFSATRYKPWPTVEHFLNKLPDGSIGLDIGCGNGKNLAVNPKIWVIGSDRSANLIKIASQKTHQTVVAADILCLPHPNSSFDFAIAIAVVHHLSTSTRRIEALRAILLTLKRPTTLLDSLKKDHLDGGRALVFVWALEQRSSRRGWCETDEQDVIVPWISRQKSAGEEYEEPKTFHRYYYLYRRGELERDVIAADGVIIDSGYEKDNWWVIAARRSLTDVYNEN